MFGLNKTKAKYTVIGSAYRADLTSAINITRHIDIGFSLAAIGFNRHADVKGYYKEEGQKFASVELSRATPCHTLQEVEQLAKLYCGAYNQDCILIVNNESLDVWLVNVDGELFAKLGKWTMHVTLPACDAYTYDGAFYYTAE